MKSHHPNLYRNLSHALLTCFSRSRRASNGGMGCWVDPEFIETGHGGYELCGRWVREFLFVRVKAMARRSLKEKSGRGSRESEQAIWYYPLEQKAKGRIQVDQTRERTKSQRSNTDGSDLRENEKPKFKRRWSRSWKSLRKLHGWQHRY